MRIRRTLGLVLAAATLAGAGAAVGTAGAQAAAFPTITREECTDAGGQVKSVPYGGETCTLPDGTSQKIT